ncbi:hypothetical protein [Candidatus Phytoplasma sacchari]
MIIVDYIVKLFNNINFNYLKSIISGITGIFFCILLSEKICLFYSIIFRDFTSKKIILFFIKNKKKRIEKQIKKIKKNIFNIQTQNIHKEKNLLKNKIKKEFINYQDFEKILSIFLSLFKSFYNENKNIEIYLSSSQLTLKKHFSKLQKYKLIFKKRKNKIKKKYKKNEKIIDENLYKQTLKENKIQRYQNKILLNLYLLFKYFSQAFPQKIKNEIYKLKTLYNMEKKYEELFYRKIKQINIIFILMSSTIESYKKLNNFYTKQSKKIKIKMVMVKT